MMSTEQKVLAEFLAYEAFTGEAITLESILEKLAITFSNALETHVLRLTTNTVNSISYFPHPDEIISEYILPFLNNSPSITGLDIDLSLFQDRLTTLTLVTDFMKENKTIIKLQISDFPLNGTQTFWDTLITNTTLTHLFLGNNMVPESGGASADEIKAFSDFIKHTTLTHFYFPMNQLYYFAGSLDWIYQALKENTHLIFIDCYANTMSLTEGKLLLEVLEFNTTLQSVNLIENDQNNSILMLEKEGGKEMLAQIKAGLTRNQPEYAEGILNSLLTISGSGMQPLVQNIILPYLGIMYKNKEKLNSVLKITNTPNVLPPAVQNVILEIQQLALGRKEENKENVEQAMQNIGALYANSPAAFQNDAAKKSIQNALDAVDGQFHNNEMLKRKTNLLRLQFGIKIDANVEVEAAPNPKGMSLG
jgi:hypothetical protein